MRRFLFDVSEMFVKSEEEGESIPEELITKFHEFVIVGFPNDIVGYDVGLS